MLDNAEDAVDVIEEQPTSSQDELPATLLDQIVTITKDLDSIRGDIRSIRVATHRGFQDIERQIRQTREEGSSSEANASECEPQLAIVQNTGIEFESRLTDVRDALKQELEERCIALESHISLVERSSAELKPMVSDTAVLQARLETLQSVIEREALQNASANAKLDNLQSSLSLFEREALQNTVAYTKLEALQKSVDAEALQNAKANEQLSSLQDSLEKEAVLREKSEHEVTERLSHLTEMLERREESETSHRSRSASLRDCESCDIDAEGESFKDGAAIANQIKDLRLCLEAEVGARSAATERLDRQMQELQSRVESDKGFKESLQELQSQMEAIQDDCNQEKRSSSPKGGGLEMEVLKVGLNNLEAQAKKHVIWVETQAEKHASRMETIENFVKKMQLEVNKECAKACGELEENLRKYMVTELKAQAKFFEGEIKGLLISSHETWADEARKLWQAVGSESSGSSRDGLKEQDVGGVFRDQHARLKAAIDSMRQTAEVTEKKNAEEIALTKNSPPQAMRESFRISPPDRVEPPPMTSPRVEQPDSTTPSQPASTSVPLQMPRTPERTQAGLNGVKSTPSLNLQRARPSTTPSVANSPRPDSPYSQNRQVRTNPILGNAGPVNTSLRKTPGSHVSLSGPQRFPSDVNRVTPSPLRPSRTVIATTQDSKNSKSNTFTR